MTRRIFLSAGEPSGDLHGGPVVQALLARCPDMVIEAFGGPRMREAGATVRWPMEEYTVMGFAEILAKVPAHYRLLKALRTEFAARRYDLVVLIDYPGFHLRVAEAARQAGIPVLYYIAPQLWAWRPERAQRFRAAVDQFAVIFPFEAEFFERLGLAARYVGHPLMDRPAPPAKGVARETLGIPADAKVLTLFPGSRPQEINRHWPALRDTAARLKAEGRVDLVLVAALGSGVYPENQACRLVAGQPELLLAAADAAILKSGTTVLEGAIADVPMVVVYRVHRLTAWFARRVMRVPWISLVNLIAGRKVVEEILQEAIVPDRLAAAVLPLLDPAHPATVEQRGGLASVREKLGGGGAAARVASMAAELLR